MKTTIKCELTMIVIAVIMTTACKKEKVNNGKIVTVSPPTTVVVPPAETVTDNRCLPAQVKNGELKMIFSYSDTLITKIEYADGKSTVLTLNDTKQPEMLETFTGTKLTGYAEYELGTDGMVSKSTHYIVNGRTTTLAGYTTLTYNAKKQLTAIKNYNAIQQLLNERTRTYDDAGKLVTETGGTPVQTVSYYYDTKYGLFKHAGFVYLFALETNDPLLLSLINNVQEISGAVVKTDNVRYDIAYNKQDYPEKIKLIANGQLKSTYEILYQ